MKNLLVMKFGGTSMGSAERIRVGSEITAGERAKRPVVVVVSAMSKITDLLLDSLRRAEAGDEAGLEANLGKLLERHVTTCRELLPPAKQETALGAVQGLGKASALDAKTQALAYLAVLAALRLESGVPFHVVHARELGASRNEVISAVLVGLPAAGNGVTQVLPAAIRAYDES